MTLTARRRWLRRTLSAGILFSTLFSTQASALARMDGGSGQAKAGDDSAYSDLGYYSDYGGGYDASSSFTYDPGATCYGVTCDGGFSDPATNFMYDASMEQESVAMDSADAFDAYIRESAPVAGNQIPSLMDAGPASFRAAGLLLNHLTVSPTSLDRSSATAGALRPEVGATATSIIARMPYQIGPVLIHKAATLLAPAASAVSVFVDTQRTYKINYPSGWAMVSHDQMVRGAYVDVRLIAPDGNAGLAGQSLTLPQGMTFSLQDPSVQNYIAGSIQFAAFGAAATGQAEMQSFTIPSGDEVLVGRVPFQWVDTSLAPSQFPNVQNGMHGGQLFVALHNNNRLYLVSGTIADLTTSSAIDDARQLSGIFSSLDLFHIYHPAGKANAIVDSTRTYRLAFPSSWSYTKNMPKGDTALVSGDHSSAVVALAAPAPKGMQQISSSYLHNVVSALGSTLGTVTQQPSYHTVMVKGSTRYAATMRFRRADGKTGKAMVVTTMHNAKVTAVVGVAMDHQAASVRAQAQQASFIVSSLHLE